MSEEREDFFREQNVSQSYGTEFLSGYKLECMYNIVRRNQVYVQPRTTLEVHVHGTSFYGPFPEHALARRALKAENGREQS